MGAGKGAGHGTAEKSQVINNKIQPSYKKKCRIQTNHSATTLIDMFYHVTQLHVFLCVSQKETGLSFRQISAKVGLHAGFSREHRYNMKTAGKEALLNTCAFFYPVPRHLSSDTPCNYKRRENVF